MGRGAQKEPTKMIVMSHMTVDGKQIPGWHHIEEGVLTKHSVIIKSPSGIVRVDLKRNRVRLSTFRLPRKALEAGEVVVRTEKVNIKWKEADTLKERKALRMFEMYDERKHGKLEPGLTTGGGTEELTRLEKKAEAEMQKAEKGSSESTNNS